MEDENKQFCKIEQGRSREDIKFMEDISFYGLSFLLITLALTCVFC
jgi:hypothetical protein